MFLMMLFSTVEIGVMCRSAFFDCDHLAKISYVHHRHFFKVVNNQGNSMQFRGINKLVQVNVFVKMS